MGILSAQFFLYFQPLAVFQVIRLFMVAAAAMAVMLELNLFFSWDKSWLYSLPLKDVSIEVFAEDLCCFIFDAIRWVDGDDVLDSKFEKRLTYQFRIAGVDENYFWELAFKTG